MWPDGFCYTLDAVAVAVVGCVYCVDAVNGDDDNDGLTPETAFASIQVGIDTAVDVDTVIVAEGTYYENINFKGKNIVLTSSNATDESVVDDTIIDGNDVNSVVTFSGTESSNCILRGFRITDGNAPEGGGIYGNGTMATIENNIIIDNKAVGFGMPGSWGRGGGLLDCNGLVQNNIIIGNGGGGMYNCDGTVRHNIISYNSAFSGGGLNSCDGMIKNNIVIGHSAVYGGGACNCNGIISNCTFVGNYAVNGSGIYDCSGSISNCIIWQNGLGAETQLQNCSVPSYSCIENWSGGGVGNISSDPCFAQMGYWQDMGTYWDWVDNDSDYHLKSEVGQWDPNTSEWVTDTNTSPCIDAGDPNSAGTAELWPHGKRINMGASGGTPQASMSLSTVGNKADLNNDGFVNVEDLALFVDMWLVEEVLLSEDINRNGMVNFSDFAEFAGQWLWEE